MRARLLVAVAILAATIRAGEAHKPITSKYTFNEHVFPIVRARCAACHVDGGIAPMSLVAYKDAYPWAESIKGELLTAHMPPAGSLSARELDVLLTWATGGTPEGPAAQKPATITLRNDWTLGAPDLVVSLPEETTLPPGTMEDTREFALPTSGIAGRAIRAVDLRPGNPAIVRAADIYIRAAKAGGERLRPARGERVFERRNASERGWGPASKKESQAGGAGMAGAARESILALWLPGGERVSATEGTAYTIPAEAQIVARIRFKKTWKYENDTVADRSEIGFYFAGRGAREIQAIPLSTIGRVRLDAPVEALAVRTALDRADADIDVHADLPNGSRVALLRATSQPAWPRRHWLPSPVRLPAGTRIVTTIAGAAAGSRVDGVALDVVAPRAHREPEDADLSVPWRPLRPWR